MWARQKAGGTSGEVPPRLIEPTTWRGECLVQDDGAQGAAVDGPTGETLAAETAGEMETWVPKAAAEPAPPPASTAQAVGGAGGQVVADGGDENGDAGDEVVRAASGGVEIKPKQCAWRLEPSRLYV